MSWLRSGSFRSNINRQQSKAVTGPGTQYDPTACFDSFKEHWQQASKIILRNQQLPSHDDVLGVVNHLEQMVTLLLFDVGRQDHLALPENESSAPCLEYLLSENILCKLYDWGTRTGRYANAVRLEQLKLYEMLISNSRRQLLVHEPFLKPLLKLLMSCQGECIPGDVEKRLVLLLNQLCVLLMQNIDLLDLFFCSTTEDQGVSKFVIFSLLIPFTHREGAIGMQARDALLLCMSLSKKNKNIGVYIAEHSNICLLLASGLGGLYSVLPNNLNDIETEDWHRFTPDDVNDIRDLAAFMTSLEFSNAVAQVAHSMIKKQLHEFLYRGFLIPVMGPALLQGSLTGQIAATAYLDLILRSVSDPGLLMPLVKFLVEFSYDGKRVLHILISRIATKTRLSLVSLALFDTLVQLNCEDIMLELVFQHLKPCVHLMTSQLNLLNDFDPYCQNVEKLLLLTPVCCTQTTNSSNPDGRRPRGSVGTVDHNRLIGTINWNHYGTQMSESLYGNYHAYLCDARNKITARKLACSNWTNKYNGRDSYKPIKNNSPKRDATQETQQLFSSSQSTYLNYNSTAGESSGYESLKCCPEDNESETNKNSNDSSDLPVWKISDVVAVNNDCQTDTYKDVSHENSSVGLFLNVLFDKLEHMLTNNLYVNIHLTGLFSQLAIYSHPLLRTYLLSYKLVLQPNVRSLYQVIGTLKQKIDEYMSKHNDSENEIKHARWFLIEREAKIINARKRTIEGNTNSVNNSFIINDPFKRDELKRRSLSSYFAMRFRRTTEPAAAPVPEPASYNLYSGWYKEKSEIKNYALCAVVLEEWLKELAAISQEHTIAQLTTTVS